MNKRGRPSRLSKKKAARIKWSRNANAAKARYRLEGPPPDRVVRGKNVLPLVVTVAFDGGEAVSFRPRSRRHLGLQVDALALYSGPEIRYGGQERL